VDEKREKVTKSKRWGSEWTREEQRRKGGIPAPRGVKSIQSDQRQSDLDKSISEASSATDTDVVRCPRLVYWLSARQNFILYANIMPQTQSDVWNLLPHI